MMKKYQTRTQVSHLRLKELMSLLIFISSLVSIRCRSIKSDDSLQADRPPTSISPHSFDDRASVFI